MKHFFTVSKVNNQYLSSYLKVKNNDIVDSESSISNNINKQLCTDGVDYNAIVDDSLNETINTTEINNIKKIQLDKYNSISISKKDFDKVKKEYKDFENCAVFSPFHVLLDQVKLEYKPNTLNVFIYNNKIYTIIVDEQYIIVHNDIKKITQNKDLDDEFINDKSMQKDLLKEIIHLEVQNSIESILENFYAQDSSFFIENIEVLDASSLLSQDNIDEICETLSLEITYKEIDISEILLRLIQKELNYQNLSYTDIEKSSSSSIKKFIFILLAILALAVAYVIYSVNLQQASIKQKIQSKSIEKKINKVQLKDHKKINTSISTQLNTIFDAITYDAYINSLKIDNDALNLNLTTLYNDTFIKNIQPNIEKVFEQVTIIDSSESNSQFDVSIVALGSIAKIHNTLDDLITYKQYRVYTQIEAQKLINDINKNVIITPIVSTKIEDKFYEYDLTLESNNLNEFKQFVDDLNVKQNCIYIQYPIEIKKKENKTIETKFKVIFEQSL
jgi:hypothetical protein